MIDKKTTDEKVEKTSISIDSVYLREQKLYQKSSFFGGDWNDIFIDEITNNDLPEYSQN